LGLASATRASPMLRATNKRVPPKIALPPTELDIVVARVIKRHTTPLAEHTGKILTFAADEKTLLWAALGYWILSRGLTTYPASKKRADHILICTAISAALPHLIKPFIERERPDRKLVHGARHGIPLSGEPMESFPSGHALHLGALASAFNRTASLPAMAIAWVSALALSSTRLLLLAHYLTDVVAGLALGVLVESGVAWGWKKSTTDRRSKHRR
jgi:membrane-associated phospholipid phosphatase